MTKPNLVKKLFCLFFLFGFYTLHAQNGDRVAYYFKGKKLSFSINRSRIVFHIKAGESLEKHRGQLAALLSIQGADISGTTGLKLVSAKLPSAFNGTKLKGLAVLLSKEKYIEYARPCFVSDYGKDMGYGDELVVRLKSSTTLTAFNQLLAQTNCTIVKKYSFANDTYIVSAGEANGFDALTVANRFFETGLFIYAEPDLTLFDGLLTDPNDPLFNYQWAHTNTGSAIQYNGVPGTDMKVQLAWNISTGTGIKVAVIDEGVDTGHADLKANLLQGYDCLSGTSNPGDGRPLGPARAHGTNCTGIIAAVANNNIGIAGVAPDSKIIPVNLAAANGAFASNAGIAAGFDYAWMNGADVISNSWGGGSPSNILEDAINRAVTLGRGGKGSVVLFASGNNNAALSYPAILENVISVGGVNMCGQRKSPASASCDGEGWGASYGTGLDVVAPCVKIASTDLSGSAGYNTAAGAAGDYYLKFNGTSSATPNTAGVVALILSANNNLTVSQVRNILEGTCDKLPLYSYSMVAGQPNGTWNNETGYGLVDAYNAVQVAVSGIFCNVEIKANGATRFCPGGSVGIDVINPVTGTSYQWRKDGVNIATGTSVIANAAGSYDVLATATNGCIATAAPVVVTVLTNTPALSVNAGVDTLICAGQSVKLGGNPVASNGAPWLPDERAYGMDWQGNSFVKFSLSSPQKLDTIAQNVVSNADYNAGYFFTGGDFTPYGYYAITAGTNKLFKIDTASGAQQLIGIAPAATGYTWCGLAWDPSTKNLYGLSSKASGSSLCIIDPFTAAVTPVGTMPVGLTEWLAVSNNGNMYAISDNNYIYSINKLTGAASALPNPVGADVIYEQDADFDPVTDKLFLTALIQSQNYVGDLRTVNTTTGISSVVGTLGGLSEIDATGIAGPGYQYNWSPVTGLNDATVAVPVATPLTTTTYTLNVTDMCGNTANAQVIVSVSTPPAVSITAPADSICVGETVRLSATNNNAYSYQWYRSGNAIAGATDSFYIANTGGTYTAKAKMGPCDSTSLPFIVKTCEVRMNSNAPAAVCNSYFYDSGGIDSAYANNESYTRTITASTAGSVPRLTLNTFSTQSANDVLTIYDGPDVTYPVLAALSGKPALPLVYTASNGALTITFNSNGSVTDSGYAGIIDCYQPNIYRSKASGNADNINTWEVKLPGGSYINAVTIPHVYDDSIIIQPGHTVSINVAMQLDQLWVQNGAVLNIVAPLTLNNGSGNDLLVDGSLVVGNAGSISGNGIVSLNGTLDNSASTSSNILARTEITGSISETITAGGAFGTLYIVNPAVIINLANDIAIDTLIMNDIAGVVTITANNPNTLLSINKRIDLQNGRLIMGNNAALNIVTGATIGGGNANSFVEGPVRNNTNSSGASSLFFPVGKNVYRPVTLNVTHSSSGLSTYQTEVFNTPANSRTLAPTINAVSGVRHFKISSISAQPLTAASATLTYGSDDGVSDPSSLRIAKDDGATNWIDLGGTGTAPGSGTITSSVNFTSFSDFVLANALGGTNVLPVKWLDVSAKLTGKTVVINWKTANEVNVSGYTIERSADGISFTNVISVNASTASTAEKQYEATDRLPLNGTNYYRIRQTDNDGKYSYSKIVLVNVTDASGFVVWPNPAVETVTIQNNQVIHRLQCYNSNGQLIFETKPASVQYTMQVQQWPSGIYHVKITSAGKVIETRFVKQ